MRKLFLLAGAAALAVTMPALAKKEGGGGGNGRGGGGGPAAQMDRGGGGGGGRGQAFRAERRMERQAQRGGGGERRDLRRVVREERRSFARADGNRELRRAERSERRAFRQAERGDARAVRNERRALVRQERQAVRNERRALVRQERQVLRDDRRTFAREERRVRQLERAPVDFVRYDDRGQYLRPAGLQDRCPPGLARQNAFCMPPGQLRKAQLIGQQLPLANFAYNVPAQYQYRFADDDQFTYRWDEGDVYRFNRSNNLVDAVIPVLGSGIALGEPLPLGYEVYNVPLAYRSYYPDTEQSFYRYDNDAIYRVDPQSGLVQGIVELLAGGGLGGLGIGDQLPSGYDVYNVPLDYRDQYYDTDESMYRYADGNIYGIDPQTQLIETVISLLG